MSETKRTKNIAFRLTDDEYAQIERAATANGDERKRRRAEGEPLGLWGHVPPKMETKRSTKSRRLLGSFSINHSVRAKPWMTFK